LGIANDMVWSFELWLDYCCETTFDSDSALGLRINVTGARMKARH
jgi:hypothetical protein